MSSKAICGLTPRYLSDPSPHNALLAYLAVATLALLVLKHTKPAPASGPLHLLFVLCTWQLSAMVSSLA